MTCELTAADIEEASKVKSDQLNADDLVGGMKTGQIRGIRYGKERRVEITLTCWHVPWRPCKTEICVMKAMWGKEPRDWLGKVVRLKHDPMVAFGGENVGGIRIDGASGINGEVSVMLNKSKGKKARRTVVEIPPIADAQAVAPIVLPAWAASGNDPLDPDQADEIVKLAASVGVPSGPLTAAHGSPSSWSTETARKIVTRLQEREAAKRGGVK